MSPLNASSFRPSPSDDERVQEAIDACRAESDDLTQPEIAFLGELLARDHTIRQRYERARRLDSAIAGALQRVPVPSVLEERLMAALSAAVEPTAGESPLDEVVAPLRHPDAEAPVADFEVAVAQSRRLSRRVWLAAGLATAAALLLAFWLWPANEYGHEAILAFGQQYFDADAARGTGVSIAEARPPGGLGLSSYIDRRTDPRWRDVRGFLGRRGVAFDLQNARGAKATLYVVKLSGTPKAARILPGTGRAPHDHPASSGERPTDAWIENGNLYVLVVDGDYDDYRQFITSGRAVI